MQTYTVYEKRVPPEDIDERATALVFVKEGFAFWALLVPALWFLAKGLWRGFLLYVALAVALTFSLVSLGLGETLAGWAGLVLNFIFAFEARDIQRASLERGGYVMKAVVSGRNLEECERRFLLEWLPEARRAGERAAVAAASDAASATQKSGSGVPIIGMFPSHGG